MPTMLVEIAVSRCPPASGELLAMGVTPTSANSSPRGSASSYSARHFSTHCSFQALEDLFRGLQVIQVLWRDPGRIEDRAPDPVPQVGGVGHHNDSCHEASPLVSLAGGVLATSLRLAAMVAAIRRPFCWMRMICPEGFRSRWALRSTPTTR